MTFHIVMILAWHCFIYDPVHSGVGVDRKVGTSFSGEPKSFGDKLLNWTYTWGMGKLRESTEKCGQVLGRDQKLRHTFTTERPGKPEIWPQSIHLIVACLKFHVLQHIFGFHGGI